MSKKRSAKRSKGEAKAAKRPVWPLLAGVVGVVALFAWLAGGGAAGSGGANPETLALGADLYAANCAQCHGGRAEGQDSIRPGGGYAADGAPLAPALNGLGHTYHHAPQHLFGVIKDGSPLPGSTMEGWADELTDREIRAVMAWFRSLWPDDVEARYSRSYG
ncbi:cytochrome c [bacterium]|nr:cytochrome c [bacterium]